MSDDNESLMVCTARLRLESAARRYEHGVAERQDELERAALAYQNALAEEERRQVVITIEADFAGSEEDTVSYEERGVVPSEVG